MFVQIYLKLQVKKFNLLFMSNYHVFIFRISATLKCNFDLRKYPLDEQHCLVEFESCTYNIQIAVEITSLA